MARTPTGDFQGQSDSVVEAKSQTISASGQEVISVPSSDFTADAEMTRDGNDLILEAPDGSTIIVEGYFLADPQPLIQAEDGTALTPDLVDSFAHSPAVYAANATAADESAVGSVSELTGQATVTRTDGTVETLTIGTPIYQGDIIETSADGAVNIVFMDETSFAVSENARLAIDEYVFDPASESGSTHFSVLRGVFVFTSGLIGRDDPDDVSIETPVGSIGIRGTIIAGKIIPGGESEITVIEGAIVVRNSTGEKTLSVQFESLKLTGYDNDIQEMGVLEAHDVGTKFDSVSAVSATLFSSIKDAAAEEQNNTPATEQKASEPVAEDDQPTTESSPVEDPVQLNLAPDAFTTDTVLTADGNLSLGLESDTTTLLTTTDMLTVTETTSTDTLPLSDTKTTDLPPPPPPSPDGVFIADSDRGIGPLGFVGGVLPENASGTAIGILVGRVVVADPQAGDVYTLDSAPPDFTMDGAGRIFYTGTGMNFEALDFVDLGVSVTRGTETASRAVTINVANVNEAPVVNASMSTPYNGGSVAMNSKGAILGELRIDDPDLTGGFAQHEATDFKINGSPVAGTFDLVYLRSIGTEHYYHLKLLPGASLPSGFSGTLEISIADQNGAGLAHTNVNLGTLAAGNTMHINQLSGTNGFRIVDHTTTGASGKLGFSVDMLDYNGDGRADILMGDTIRDRAYGVYGTSGPTGGIVDISSLSALSGDASDAIGFKIQGSNSDSFGTSISSLGDIDGDNKDDFIVGEPNRDKNDGKVEGGTASVYRTSGLETHDIKGSDVTADKAGVAVAGLGDINNDGYNDFALTFDGDDEVHIRFGMATSTLDPNLANHYMHYDNPASTDDVVGDTTGGRGYKFGTNDGIGSPDEGLGFSIHGMGDFNADGINDFIVSAPNFNSGATDAGMAYIMYGKTGAYGTTDLATLGNLSSGSTTTALGITALGTGSGGAKLGTSVSSAGDFNGDGISDIIVSAPGIGSGKGSAYVIYGNSDAHDITGAVDVLNNFDHDGGNLNGFVINNTGASGFAQTVAGIGDFNGDGLDDVAATNQAEGKVYVFYGKSIGSGLTLSGNPSAADGFVIDVKLDGWGSLTSAEKRISIAGGEDVNGDGYADLAIGTFGQTGHGTVSVIYGGNFNGSGTVLSGSSLLANATQRDLIGTAGSDMLHDGMISDVSMRGGTDNDMLNINNAGFQSLDGGTGYDKLVIHGTGTLDFSFVGSEKIRGIEEVVINSGKTLELTVENIFNMLNSSDTGDLRITADGAGAILKLHSANGADYGDDDVGVRDALQSGAPSATLAMPDAGYFVYKIGGHSLYIESDLALDVVPA